ncbi:unnamed protein product [Plutella xylostella]|uniref:(diamondback moth) hypothetical protein n=1 Tax=Plutella xylostella TaxID=51655 RepID=A0A8S4DS91_PLUXY|nr:unnamed protein product [Plutella xylostella]
MNQSCVFCLSQDRYLLPLDTSSYLTVYPSFKEDIKEYIHHLQAQNLLKLCWECQRKVMNIKKFMEAAQKCAHTLKMFLEFPTGDLPKSESRLQITTADIIDISPVSVIGTMLEEPPKIEQNIDELDVKLTVEPLEPEIQTNINLDVIKIEDTFDDNSTHYGNTCLDDDSDDDVPLIVKATALSPLKTRKSIKKPKNTKRKQIRKGKKQKPLIPLPLKYTEVWASTEQAMRWHREELRRAREASFSFVHECDACERLFAEEEELNTHVQDTHSEEAGQYTCDMCLYRFPDQTKLHEHMQAHYVFYKCKECAFESRILEEMQKHVTDTHTVIAPDKNEVVVCKRCKNEFGSEIKLKAHMLTCKTYKCVDCNETFPAARAYHQHRQKHRLDPDGIYCEVCKIYYKASWYKKHLLTSTKHVSRDSFKYECEICHLKFPASSRLKQHLYGFHKRPGPFPCELCPRSYFNKFRLVRHCASVHKIGTVTQKEKNKMCETCGRGFASNTVLANHMRTHSGERPYRCGDCPAAFAHHGAYYTHVKRLHGKIVDRYGTVTRAEK